MNYVGKKFFCIFTVIVITICLCACKKKEWSKNDFELSVETSNNIVTVGDELIVTAKIKSLREKKVEIWDNGSMPFIFFYEENAKPTFTSSTQKVTHNIYKDQPIVRTEKFSPQTPGNYIIKVVADFWIDEQKIEIEFDDIFIKVKS